MHVTEAQRQLLKKYGFKWFKDHCTDTVADNLIEDILPAAGGFTVVYTEDAAIRYSTAKVSNIIVPDKPKMQWIFVVWDYIEDELREAKPPLNYSEKTKSRDTLNTVINKDC